MHGTRDGAKVCAARAQLTGQSLNVLMDWAQGAIVEHTLETQSVTIVTA
jgi:hypothetical protein